MAVSDRSLGHELADKVAFAIGTGRCGTLFLYELLAKEPEVATSHERNPVNEAFHRYCRWHGLPVDDEGFLATKEKEIAADLEQRCTLCASNRRQEAEEVRTT
jgi:hypothetical protein